MSYFVDILLAAIIAGFAFGLVWFFFRLFVPTSADGEEPKWRVPAAVAGFVAIFTTLATIYLPYTTRPSGNILSQETTYGALEVDVERLFVSRSGAEVRLTEDFYVDPDTSYYVQVPHHVTWDIEADSTPTFLSSVELQTSGAAGPRLLVQLMTGLPQIDDSRVARFCVSDRDGRSLTYDTDTALNGRPIFRGMLSEDAFWDHYLEVLPRYLRLVLPDSLKSQADDLIWSAAERDEAIATLSIVFPETVSDPPVEHEFRNSLCIASVSLEDLRSDVDRAIGLPRRPFTLMSLASTMDQIHSGFSLKDAASIEVSSDNRAMLLRSPVRVTNALMDGTFHESLVVERLYLIALGPPTAFVAQVQFLLGPGQDLSHWRDIQESFRTLRFLVN